MREESFGVVTGGVAPSFLPDMRMVAGTSSSAQSLVERVKFGVSGLFTLE